jgi:S1-C subfamily serine protease
MAQVEAEQMGQKGIGQGAIVALSNTEKQGKVIKTTAFCNPGSSGGPLLDKNGLIIGIVYAKPEAHGDDKCFSIPSEKLLPYLEQQQ